jgi:hypothetical protein
MSGLDGFKENFVVHCCDKLSCQVTRRESGVEEIEIGPGLTPETSAVIDDWQ